MRGMLQYPAIIVAKIQVEARDWVLAAGKLFSCIMPWEYGPAG
jgi:hypothetical protein